MSTGPIRMRVKDVEPLFDFALLQPLGLLPSEHHLSERLRIIVRRSATSSNDPASCPGRMTLPAAAYSAEVVTSATKAGSYGVFGGGE